MTRAGPLLAGLTLLFALRVLGQALVAFFGVAWLPPMEQWFSGLIPYPTLLAIQIAMLLVMMKIVFDVWRAVGLFAATQSRGVAGFLLGFSAVYAGAMALRYVITMVLYPEMRWSGGAIPIFFHFVLAAFIYVLGRHYNTRSDRLAGSCRHTERHRNTD